MITFLADAINLTRLSSLADSMVVAVTPQDRHLQHNPLPASTLRLRLHYELLCSDISARS